jgi:hypothetical protein
LRDQLLKEGSCKKLLLAGAVSIFIIATTLASSLPYFIGANVYAQKASKSSDIPGNVVNSKYLTITDHRYRQGEFTDTITGTIVNNSTQEISIPTVYVALYDSNNTLITMQTGLVSVSSLKAGDDSPFTIDIGIKGADHYTLFPAGTPNRILFT